MTNIERFIERIYESESDKEEYDMKKIINPWKDIDRKSTRLNSSHASKSRMPSSA